MDYNDITNIDAATSDDDNHDNHDGDNNADNTDDNVDGGNDNA